MVAAGAAASSARTGLRVGASFRSAQLVSLLRAFDLTTVTASFVVGVCVTTRLGFSELLSTPVSALRVFAVVGLIAVWWAGTSALRLYDTRGSTPSYPWLSRGTQALLLGLVTGVYGALLLEPGLLSPLFVATFTAVSLLGLVARRLTLRLVCGRDREAASRHRQVLVVGTGARARSIARRIDEDPTFRAHVVGFVDDDWAGMSDFRTAGGVLACDLKNLDQFLLDHTVDEIVVALPLTAYRKHRSRLLALARSYGLTVRFPMSQLVDPAVRGDGSTRDELLLSIYHGGREGWLPALKRMLDPVLASALLVATVPLFLTIVALIKLDSRGPAFFVQERVGLNRRRFRMYKFRTMVVDAESRLAEIEHLNETGGPTFKVRGDPRVTLVGRWLRRTSLDELPQLLNIVTGEMSLVGPRPLPVRDVAGFDAVSHQRRFSVLPGLTGLWQVSGRSSLPFETWMELDLRYVEEWSLGLDLRILARTIPAVFSGRGAE